MSLENNPKIDLESKERELKLYQNILAYLKESNFDLTPTEAVFLRQTVKDVLNENKKTYENINKTRRESIDVINNPFFEIVYRFFWHLYGINLAEFYEKKESLEDWNKNKKEIFKYVQEKLRKDTELI